VLYIEGCSVYNHGLQHEGRLVYATASSFVAGGPEPREGGGLGQAQTVMV